MNPNSNDRHGLFRLNPSVYSVGLCDGGFLGPPDFPSFPCPGQRLMSNINTSPEVLLQSTVSMVTSSPHGATSTVNGAGSRGAHRRGTYTAGPRHNRQGDMEGYRDRFRDVLDIVRGYKGLIRDIISRLPALSQLLLDF